MSEQPIRREMLRAGTPLALERTTLIPIERVVVQTSRSAARAWLSVIREPYALVIRDLTGLRAVSAAGEGASVEQLREEVPELDALL